MCEVVSVYDSFIENIFYESAQAQAGDEKATAIHQEQLILLMENEDALCARLSGEEKALFLAYANAWSIVVGTTAVENFKQGFRIGASFACDALADGGAEAAL